MDNQEGLPHPDPTVTTAQPASVAEIEKVAVRHLRDLMSPTLYRKLRRMNINTVLEMKSITKETFRKSGKSGYAPWKHMRNLLAIINDNPDRVLATYLKNKEQELPFALEKTSGRGISASFYQAVKDFFSLVDNEFAKDSIFKSYGLDGKRYSLEEIGVFHGRTRERVRQVVLAYRTKLVDLAKGMSLVDVNCVFSEYLQEEMVNLRKYLKLKPIHDTAAILQSFLAGTDKKSHKTKLNSVDILLLDLLGYDILKFRQSIIVFSRRIITKPELERMVNALVEAMRNRVVSSTLFEILVTVKKELNRRDIKNSIISLLCDVLPEIQKSRNLREKAYEVRFDLLRSQNDRAYRILREVQKPMHFVEIQRMIKARLLELGVKRLPRSTTLNALSSDGRFVPQGRSGHWALREWGETGKTILELMKEAFIGADRPCSLNEISNFVIAKRSAVKKGTISSYLHMYNDVFTRVIGSKYILSEWQQNYKGKIPRKISIRTRPRISTPEYNEYVIGLFLKAEGKELRKQSLVEQLCHRFRLSDPGARDRIGRTEYLITRKSGTKCFLSLSPQYNGIIQSQIDRTNLSELIANKVRERLEKSPGRIVPMRNLVKSLSREYHFKTGTVYRVISKSQQFFKSTHPGSSIVELGLVEDRIQPEHRDNDLREIDLILSIGENKSVEFKSSLRWDNRTHSVNKELEIEIARAVCGFANTEGGRLFIGVDDSRLVVGLENDYQTFGKKSRDGFQLQLNNLLNTCLGKDIHSNLTVRFLSIENKDICEIKVSKSKPVFLNNRGQIEFHVRASGSTLKLNAREQYDYIREHWKQGIS